MPNHDLSAECFTAHSYMEIHLFFQVMVCGKCGQGPLSPLPPTTRDSAKEVMISSVCSNCEHSRDYLFQLPSGACPTPQDALTHINETEEPSKMIDLAQWLTLDHMLFESSKKESDSSAARLLGLKASLCLTEALKFFDDPDNDLPPIEAFFDDTLRTRFRQNPGLYTRQRIIALRANRPVPLPSEL